jgi:Family of unknown function (DUF6636)
VAAALIALALGASSPLVHFQSPSGNINCLGSKAAFGQPAFLQCLVRTNTWARAQLKPKPASCDLDWDPATLSLGRGKVYVGSCRGDIGPLCVNSNDRCFTLAYGRAVVMGPIRCTSLKAGVRCEYRASHVGFRIAREGYVLYR